jgi:hypothetical protein
MYVSIITVFYALAAIGIPSVYAGGPRYDYDEAFENVPGSPECWTDGFDDGANESFDEDRANECADIPGDQYNRAFELADDICFNEKLDDDGRDCEKARNDN